MPEPPSLNGMWIELQPARALGENLGVDVLVSAHAGAGVAHLFGVLLGVVDELGEGLRREIAGRRHEEHRRVGEPRDDLHVAVVVDFHALGEQDGRQAIGRDIADHDGVAVGLRARHFLDGNDARGAGLVLDQHVLSERFAKLLGVMARHRIGQAAGCVGDENPDRAARVGALCERGARGKPNPEQRQCNPDQTAHDVLPLSIGSGWPALRLRGIVGRMARRTSHDWRRRPRLGSEARQTEQLVAQLLARLGVDRLHGFRKSVMLRIVQFDDLAAFGPDCGLGVFFLLHVQAALERNRTH